MMRKLFVALLVGAVVVGLAAPAFAADLKFTGAYRVRFQFDENLPCADASGEPSCSGNDFQTRFRPRFTVETEGGVTAVLWLEIGDLRFGRAGGGHGADGTNVETKNAYIDFPVPATPLRLRAGVQNLFFSKALFFDDDVSALQLYGKLGQVDTRLWWTRLNKGGAASFIDQTANLNTNSGLDVDAQGARARDLYAIDVSFSPTRDLNLNAYFLYDHDNEIGDLATGEATSGFWIGAAAAGKVQNIRWDLDFVYGTHELTSAVDVKGWGVDGGVGMALAGTPLDLEVRGWYFTGADEDLSGDIDAFPVLYAGSGGHEPGTQVWGGGGVIDIDALADNPQNTWGLGVIARYTATPTLRLTGNVHYIGTVEEGDALVAPCAGDCFLFGVDSVGTEVGVRIDYTIHRGLVFTLTAGHLFLGDDTSTIGTQFDDITKVAGVLNYGF